MIPGRSKPGGMGIRPAQARTQPQGTDRCSGQQNVTLVEGQSGRTGSCIHFTSHTLSATHRRTHKPISTNNLPMRIVILMPVSQGCEDQMK